MEGVELGVPAAGPDQVVVSPDFSLLHDDGMDGDLTRRGRPAAWAVFGEGQPPGQAGR